MNRRAFLAWAAAGTVGGLAGCATGTPATDTDTTGGETTATGTETATASGEGGAGTATERPGDASSEGVSSVAGTDLPVPKDELTRGAAKDAIPAITDPVFAPDWSGLEVTFNGRRGIDQTIEPRLQSDDRVIGVRRDGQARAYPLRVLAWHEIVNDSFGGPLLVTYCPLCGSSVTARRTVDGQPTTFGVSGYLWNSNLVMYDELTGSLWSQLAATAIRGPETGERLSLLPSTVTTWETWRGDHPDTAVLLPPPKSNTVVGEVSRNYNRDIYRARGYYESEQVGLGENELPEGASRLHPKTQVLGIASGGAAKAYPLPAVRDAGVVNDRVGDLPVVVTIAADDTTLVGYVRRIDGEVLTFERASATHLRAGGSRWRITTGTAVDGPHEGTTLAPASETPPEFWFAWLDFHPDTTVYQG